MLTIGTGLAIMGFGVPITAAILTYSPRRKKSSLVPSPFNGNGTYLRKDVYQAERTAMMEKLKGHETWLKSIDGKVDELLKRH